MKWIQIIILILSASYTYGQMPKENELLNLYDSFSEEAGDAILDWGFSALVRYDGKLILFDGGSSADILQQNEKALGLDLTKVDIAILSHSHPDHISGFDYLLKINPEVELFFPFDRFIGAHTSDNTGEAEKKRKYQRWYRFRDANINFVKENTQIAPGIALIPTISSLVGRFSKYPPYDKEPQFIGLSELSLALQTKNKEWTLIVGCSHSQVEEIVRETKKYVKNNVTGVAGGFHLLPYSSDYISDIANMMKKDLQVNWVAPGHCTGNSAHKIFKALYQDNYKYFGLGSRIKY